MDEIHVPVKPPKQALRFYFLKLEFINIISSLAKQVWFLVTEEHV